MGDWEAMALLADIWRKWVARPRRRSGDCAGLLQWEPCKVYCRALIYGYAILYQLADLIIGQPFTPLGGYP